MNKLIRLLGLGILGIFGSNAALACNCERVSPSVGFDRAQYVFTGKVVEAKHHLWRIAVDRVWKGSKKIAGTVRLMDAYPAMVCETFFELGRSYLIFAVLGKGVLGKDRDLFYHPLVCSWTGPLHSNRVVTRDNESLWVEDFIVREHGPGEPAP